MSIETAADLQGMKRIGRIVASVLDAARRAVRAGMTTRELDALCGRELDRLGARSTPQHEYGFPGVACLSVNDEVVHGVGGDRRLGDGDVVKIDLTADIDGYVADAARTVVIGQAPASVSRLVEAAEQAFGRALDIARAGAPIRSIGRTVEHEVRTRGFSVVPALCGHGVGRRIHEPPNVPNFDDPHCRGRLSHGLVITIEPIITAGRGHVVEAGDGWTIRTADGSLAAHYEDTVVITDGRPLVLTAA